MITTKKNQGTITKFEQDTHLLTWIEAFLIDRKAQGLSEGTLYFYQKKLKLFTDYCEAQFISQITEINPSFLRGYILYLEKTHLPSRDMASVRSCRKRHAFLLRAFLCNPGGHVNLYCWFYVPDRLFE